MKRIFMLVIFSVLRASSVFAESAIEGPREDENFSCIAISNNKDISVLIKVSYNSITEDLPYFPHVRAYDSIEVTVLEKNIVIKNFGVVPEIPDFNGEGEMFARLLIGANAEFILFHADRRFIFNHNLFGKLQALVGERLIKEDMECTYIK